MRTEVRSDATTGADLALIPGQNLVVGDAELARQLGGAPLTSLELDLLTIAAAVYATDLASHRLPRARAYRDLDVTVPVANIAALEGVLDDLRLALSLLSQDNWQIRLVQGAGTPESGATWVDRGGTTLLFSGGLDSLGQAVRLLELGVPTQLVSHYTANPTIKRSQESLYGYLRGKFGAGEWIKVRVGGRKTAAASFPSDHERENSQRTRSFLFVVLASIVARRTGHWRVLMVAENGPMAIHLALSTARLGPFSTHTAHPEYLLTIGEVLSRVLRCPITIENPFVYMTKAEVVEPIVRNHPTAIAMSVSCWKGSRQAVNHCGICVPCLIRRLSLEYSGYANDQYERDLMTEDLASLPPDDDGLRNLTDLVEFVTRWTSHNSNAELTESFPDLYNRAINLPEAVAMYGRFAAEAMNVIERYPSVRALV